MFLTQILSLMITIDFVSPFPNAGSLREVEEPSWPKFTANLSAFLTFTSFVDIIETAHSPGDTYDVKDFSNFLVKYLQEKQPIAINTYKTANLTCSLSNCDVLQTLSSYSQKQSIFFCIYNSHSQFHEAFLRSRSSILKNVSVSVFFIISMEKGFNELPCTSANIEGMIRHKYGRTLHSVWKEYKFPEIFIIMPQFCAENKILKFDPLVRCNTEKECFEKNVLIISDEVYQEKTAKFSHKMVDFNKYPLRVNAFTREPTLVVNLPRSLRESYYINDLDRTNYMGGVDGFFIGNLIKKLNFQPIFSSPADDKDFGMRLDNGTLIGSLADIAEGRSDISINARFFKLYKTDQITFTLPIEVERVCLIALKSKRIPNWLSILQVFKASTWYLIITTSLLLAIIWKIFKSQSHDVSRKRKHQRDENAFSNLLLLIINHPIPMPRKDGERLFIIVCLFFNLLFVGIFQGYLTTAYTTKTYFKDINTFQEVYDSGLKVASSFVDLFGVDISPLMTNLNKRIVTLESGSMSMVETMNIFAVERDTDAAIKIERNYSTPSGEPRLHIVQECPRFYYLNYIVNKKFPFLTQINRFLMSINSAGLPTKWYDINKYFLLLNQRLSQTNDNDHKPLSNVDMQAAFFSLWIGLCFCLLVFFYEIISFKCNRFCCKKQISS